MTNERRNMPLHVVPSGARERGQPTDSDLARALIAGEPWAVPATWNRFAQSVYGIAHRAFGRTTDAEDITQEVFYRLFARVHTLKEPSALRSFVVSFAIRIVKWELRRRRVRRFVHLADSGELPDATAPAVDTESRQVLQRFYGVLDRLGARDRLVFSLRYLECMTLEEVASAMELSLSTVKRSIAHSGQRISAWIAGDPDLAAFFERRRARS
ncbi:MAG TPA: sigma-70 family RNA polymerase sigma factor [Polyangia bacterium]